MTDKTTAAEHAECLINAATEVESIDTVECAILGVTMRNAAAELTRLEASEAALRAVLARIADIAARYQGHVNNRPNAGLSNIQRLAAWPNDDAKITNCKFSDMDPTP